MNVLGIDTSTATGGVAIVKDLQVLANYQLSLDSSHSMRLFPVVHRVLEDTKLALTDMDAIAIAQGPGSFTGLRIGVMAAKTMAHLGGLPLVGVSTLEALAYPLRFSPALICPVMDALRGDIYGAIYTSQEGLLTQCIKDNLFSLTDYLSQVEKSATSNDTQQGLIFIGNGVSKYRKEIEERFGGKAIFPSGVLQTISPAVVAELGLEKLEKGTEKGTDPLSFQPTYLRRPEAEVVYEKRVQNLPAKV